MKDFFLEIVAVILFAVAGTVFAKQLAIFEEWRTSDSFLLRGVAFLLGAGGLLLVGLVVIWLVVLPGLK